MLNGWQAQDEYWVHETHSGWWLKWLKTSNFMFWSDEYQIRHIQKNKTNSTKSVWTLHLADSCHLPDISNSQIWVWEIFHTPIPPFPTHHSNIDYFGQELARTWKKLMAKGVVGCNFFPFFNVITVLNLVQILFLKVRINKPSFSKCTPANVTMTRKK